MAEHRYSAADITILEFDDSVRTRTAMYFRASRESPELATRVLSEVVGHALHPATRVGPPHTARAHAEISADLAFSVEDDLTDALDDQGRPRPGYYDSLLGPDRWLSGAAAALSGRTVVEVWRDGRGFRQELAGLRPLGAPEEFEPSAGGGTRLSCELDPALFAPGSAITTDLDSLDLHGTHCPEPHGGHVTIRDLRTSREWAAPNAGRP
ncbi:hypothetical protein Pth03_73370 [Planotetraspora thailandica]|uniref:Uncharacterized protein n=1 Tax=Planotetraspora thailandica TaxID=487172 RepID=A0A8J4DE64_9ACTN|nr:hypothetical protein [Planotetraspora thailandica]GII58948.1 hypothetical protein Pth03_73370 [Planotetraspora thailandica]